MGYVGLKNHEKHYNKPPTALSCPPIFTPFLPKILTIVERACVCANIAIF